MLGWDEASKEMARKLAYHGFVTLVGCLTVFVSETIIALIRHNALPGTR